MKDKRKTQTSKKRTLDFNSVKICTFLFSSSVLSPWPVTSAAFPLSGVRGAGPSPGAAAVIPDGGLHAWIIVVACFLTNGILFGICNCFGILYVYFKKELEQAGTKDATVIACELAPFRPSHLAAPSKP